MEKLKDLPLVDRLDYGPPTKNYYGRGRFISDTWQNITRTNNPIEFKTDLLRIIQVCFDSVVRQINNEDARPDKISRGAFGSLCEIGEDYISAYYTGLGKRIGPFRERIIECREILLVIDPNLEANRSHLEQEDVEINRFGKKAFELSDLNIDTIVPVMSEGIEPAFLASNVLGNPPILPVRYSRVRLSDSEPWVGKFMDNKGIEELVRGKKIFVVEGTINTGESLLGVIDSLNKYSPSEIYAGSVRIVTEEIHKSKYLADKCDPLNPGEKNSWIVRMRNSII
ncbi:MAG: phosphoribosyltransferase [Nanoarchaeota archaeon]